MTVKLEKCQEAHDLLADLYKHYDDIFTEVFTPSCPSCGGTKIVHSNASCFNLGARLKQYIEKNPQ